MNELHEALVALEKLKAAGGLDEAGAAKLALLLDAVRELATHVLPTGLV